MEKTTNFIFCWLGGIIFTVLSFQGLFPLETPLREKIFFIGQSSTPTGVLGDYQEAINAGIRSYLHSIDHKLKDRIIKFEAISNDGNVISHMNNIKKFTEKGCTVFLGNMGTRNLLSSYPLIKEKKIAQLFPWGGTLCMKKLSDPYLIHGSEIIEQHVDALIRYAVKTCKFNKIALVHSQGTFGKEVSAYAQEKLHQYGIKGIKITPFNSKTLQINKTCDDLIKADPEAIIFLGTSRPTSKIIRKIGKTLPAATYFGIESSYFVPDLIKPNQINLFLSRAIPPLDTNDFPITNEFLQAFFKLYPGQKPNLLSFIYYINTKILLIACRKIIEKEQPLNHHSIVQELSALEPTDLGGFQVEFSRKNRLTYRLHITVFSTQKNIKSVKKNESLASLENRDTKEFLC